MRPPRPREVGNPVGTGQAGGAAPRLGWRPATGQRAVRFDSTCSRGHCGNWILPWSAPTASDGIGRGRRPRGAGTRHQRAHHHGARNARGDRSVRPSWGDAARGRAYRALRQARPGAECSRAANMAQITSRHPVRVSADGHATLYAEVDPMTDQGRAPIEASGPLAPDALEQIDAYWRAANYLSVGQIYLLDNPLLREPLAPEHVQAAPARPLGHDARAELHLRPHEPGHPRAGTSTRSTSSGPGTAARRSSRTPTSRGPTREVYPSITRDADGHAPAVPAVLVPRRHPQPRRAGDARARSTRAASSATRCPTPTAPRSTIRTWSSAASSATARPRPGRSPRAGTRTSSSTPSGTAPSCRSSTSTATRSRTRRSSPGSPRTSCVPSWRATAITRTSSRATTRP